MSVLYLLLWDSCDDGVYSNKHTFRTELQKPFWIFQLLSFKGEEIYFKSQVSEIMAKAFL